MTSTASPLHVAPTDTVDLDAAARAVADLLVALGQDPTSAELVDTPSAAAHALADRLTPEPFEMTTFPNDGAYDEMVLVRDISFEALSAHDLLSFGGVAHVAYVPGTHVVGLSKLARLVEHLAHRLQTPQRLASSIADTLCDTLHPRGVGAVVEADDGGSRSGSATGRTTRVTAVALRGSLRDDEAARAELLTHLSTPAR